MPTTCVTRQKSQAHNLKINLLLNWKLNSNSSQWMPKLSTVPRICDINNTRSFIVHCVILKSALRSKRISRLTLSNNESVAFSAPSGLPKGNEYLHVQKRTQIIFISSRTCKWTTKWLSNDCSFRALLLTLGASQGLQFKPSFNLPG